MGGVCCPSKKDFENLKFMVLQHEQNIEALENKLVESERRVKKLIEDNKKEIGNTNARVRNFEDVVKEVEQSFHHHSKKTRDECAEIFHVQETERKEFEKKVLQLIVNNYSGSDSQKYLSIIKEMKL